MPYYARYLTTDTNRVIRGLSRDNFVATGETVVSIGNTLPAGILSTSLSPAIGKYRVQTAGDGTHSLVAYTPPAETDQDFMNTRLTSLRNNYDLVHDYAKLWWPKVVPSSQETVSNEALQATRLWIDIAFIVTAQIIRGRYSALSTEAARLGVFNAFEAVFLNPTLIKVWYDVMVSNSSRRASWRQEANIAQGSRLYADWVNTDGTSRDIDGMFIEVFPGMLYPANVNMPLNFGD